MGADRVRNLLDWKPIDRVPIEPPVPVDLIRWREGWRPESGWMAEDNFLEVAELAAEHCDGFWNLPGVGHLFDRRFALIPRDHIHVVDQSQAGTRHTTTTVVTTPRGDLRTVDARDEGVSTGWYIEPLCKSRQDAEKLLEIPFEVGRADLTELRAQSERAGGIALSQVCVSTPLVSAGRLFHFDQWLEWCAGAPDFVEKVVAVHAERIAAQLEVVLQAGVGEVFWFGGSEQATPPMMSEALFDRLVAKYDAPLMRMVKEHGRYVHVHCHGLIDRALDKFMDMGADCLDPCEPAPDGDLDFARAKRRARGRTVLIGNIEFRHMEHTTPDTIERLVRAAINDGGKEGVFLGLSATSISRLTDRYRDNAIRYIETGLDCGGM